MTTHDAIEALFLQGNQQMAAGDHARAEACFRQAIASAPEIAELHANLGLLLEKRGDLPGAEAGYRNAIALNPGLAQIHSNLGVLLAKKKRFHAAELAHVRALSINADSASAWSNLGMLYASIKRESEAEDCYRTAMQLDPHHQPSRFNLSYLLLCQGHFEEGWHCLESRDGYAPFASALPCPRWQGESLTGKSILIGIEAGHGDMIQFCRYAEVLKTQGTTRIGLLCHPALKKLFATLDAVDSIMALGEPIPSCDWDYWTPPMSIPHYCATRLESIPASLPYLYATPEKIAQWQDRIPQDGLRVGLAWKGNPRFENDADRSLPTLDLLAPLGEINGVHFISLQKGAGAAEADSPPSGMAMHSLGAEIEDFSDSAAIMAQLDLVISVDTATAHLAGALGKPCWVLLPDYQTDWRWLTGRTDSPWYPDVMRLFRQSSPGNWTDVIAEVKAALCLLVQRSA